MKKLTSLLATTFLVAISTTGCSSSPKVDRTLTIYNWQDYIFEGSDAEYDEEGNLIAEEIPSVIDQFIEEYQNNHNETISVEYYTFETNENMLNVLSTGKSQYDLVCPSDYTIQKMIKDDMLEPLDKDAITNYNEYASPYIRDELFASSSVTLDDGTQVSWADYSIPYFWGTMGFMYDPEEVDEQDIQSWGVLWDENYKGKSTLKDSVRDTLCVGLLHTYADTPNPKADNLSLNQIASLYENGSISAEKYTEYVQIIMNDVSDESLALVESDLKKAKDNVYGFEVDSGKSDIVTGKIDINFCWSGDAVYALDCAEEESDVELNYVVPKEGSNVWVDGWVMPKGSQTDLAQEFLNFISRPDIAALNMNEVGYTSVIAGQEIYDLASDWYAACTEDDEFVIDVYDQATIDEMVANEELYEYDLSYFFGDTIDDDVSPIIYADTINRQFSAQFPSRETLYRCAVMEDFGDANENVLQMWVRVKSNDVPTWAWLFILIVFVLATSYGVYKYIDKKSRKDRMKEEKAALKNKAVENSNNSK